MCYHCLVHTGVAAVYSDHYRQVPLYFMNTASVYGVTIQ